VHYELNDIYYERKDLKVVIGAHNVNDATVHSVPVSYINVDPDYATAPYDNDMSILTLAQPVTFSDTVSPACLPSDGTQDYAGQEATVIGWGIIEDGSRPSVLQEANVTVITNEQCDSEWANLIVGHDNCMILKSDM